MRTLLVVILCLGLATKAAAAPERLATGHENDNLGEGLLEGLLEDLQFANPPAARERPPAAQPAAGEDVGQESPLAPIARQMHDAARLIDPTTGSEDPTPLQERVVAELEALIEQMEKQCQGGGGQCKKPPQDKKQTSQRSKPKPGQCEKPGASKPGAKPGQTAARDSTTQLGSAPTATGVEPSPADMMKAAWGHLPSRVREQMVQSSTGEFLPEYREELERYFQRLAEREASEGNE